MNAVRFVTAAATLLLFCAPAQAQTADPPPPVPSVAAEPTPCCLAVAGTIIELQLVGPVSTRTARRGDQFEIRLAEPLVIDGKVVVPAGVMGLGQIVHAAGPSIGGKPGELILAARFLQFGDQRISLKAMKLGKAGNDNSAAVLIGSMITPLAMFVTGGQVEIPAGTRANAKIAADFTAPPLPAVAALPPAAPATPAAPAPSQTPAKESL